MQELISKLEKNRQLLVIKPDGGCARRTYTGHDEYGLWFMEDGVECYLPVNCENAENKKLTLREDGFSFAAFDKEFLFYWG